MVGACQRRARLARAFTTAAFTYWLGVFPNVNREIRHWRDRAGRIPDRRLRGLALTTHRGERGNLEGAAAFAVLVPGPSARRGGPRRGRLPGRSTTTSTRSPSSRSADPTANGRSLHLALPAALDPRRAHADYYRHRPFDGDGDYLAALVDACREALAGLPSYGIVRDAALRCAERMVDYQSLNHTGAGERHETLARWAAGLAPDSGLRWWEAAAGAASSLGVFALFAAAARPSLDPARREALRGAYFPWIGALHVLLDSLVDRAGRPERRRSQPGRPLRRSRGRRPGA